MDSRRYFWIGTSWKMNKTIGEAVAYARAVLAEPARPPSGVRIFVLPPFTALSAVAEAIGGKPLMLGAQTMHWADAGAYTGEISPLMLRDCGVAIVELGHSERRTGQGESDAQVNMKVKAALRHGLMPLVCVGETGFERESGVAVETVLRQAKIAFSGVAPHDLGRCLVAYEPVWAIGSGATAATLDQIVPIHRQLALALAGSRRGESARPAILYGGSVDAGNVAALAARPEIEGLFIGRAALSPQDFVDLIDRATTARAVSATSMKEA